MSNSIPSDAPRPRLCHLRKWPDFNGYGFNLHAERGKTGHYVGSIDDYSPAQAAGLRIDDRIVEVNGVNIGNENHRQVVERVKSVANETKLLVIDREGDAFYQDLKMVITGDMSIVDYRECPSYNPYSDESTEQDVASTKSSSSEVHFEAAAPTPVAHSHTVGHGHTVGQDHHVGQDHTVGQDHHVGHGHTVGQDHHVGHSHTVGQDHHVSHGHTVGQDHHLGQDHNQVRNVDQGRTVNQGSNNGLQFPSSAREAREKMSKKRGAKATGMTLKDKYDLLQQL